MDKDVEVTLKQDSLILYICPEFEYRNKQKAKLSLILQQLLTLKLLFSGIKKKKRGGGEEESDEIHIFFVIIQILNQHV